MAQEHPDFVRGIVLGGEIIPAHSGETFEVVDPATEQPLAQVANAGSREWMRALDTAVAVQPAWEATSPRCKSELLRAIFQAIHDRAEEFARTMVLEMGKPWAEAMGEVSYGAEYFQWFAEEAVRLPGRFGPAPSGGGDILVTREAVGPVLAITPWNFPLAMATRKIAPALAAGCPVIVKPAAETPLTMLLLGSVINQVCERLGQPRGLVSIIPTLDAAGLSAELMADARLAKVTFTGSTAVGKLLTRQAADNLLRTSMELGGNAPFVVAADANIDTVLSCAMQAKMRNGGQACIAANRFIVHSSLAAEFTSRLTQHFQGLQLGHGLKEGTTLGPVITAAQRDRIAALVDNAVQLGATITCGGPAAPVPAAGYFYPATVLKDVPLEAAIIHSEIFGPVATVSVFEDLATGIAMANDTEFGLAAYGFSQDADTLKRLAKELKAGMVGLNRGAISDPAAPFGGIKQSGFGREGGSEGIEEYLETKYVAL